MPIACFHGFLGRPSMWAEVLAAAAHPGPVALATLPGHGPSPWFPAGGAAFFDAVDALADALPFDRPACLVGYSLGARVALALALRHPSRIASAVLLGVHPGLRSVEERAQRVAWDDAERARLLELGLPAFVDAWERLPLFASQEALPPAVRAAQRRERLEHEPAGLAWSLEALGLGRMPSMWEALTTCRAPLWLVTGALDAKFDALAREARLAAPASAHRVAKGVGHNVALEAPAFVASVLAEALSA